MTATKKFRKHHESLTRSALVRSTGLAFRGWFEAQHGKRPNTGDVSDEKLREMIILGESAGKELYARKIYDAKRQSALYAWTVKGQDRAVARRSAPGPNGSGSK